MKPISVIVTTYNRPETLELVLLALNAQDQSDFEVIIADDGSTDTTRDMISRLLPSLSYPLHHVWQPDEGFQATKIRNSAVAKASGEYLIFLDGDCVPPSRFLQRHKHFAEDGWFVTGNRILLNKNFTEQVIQQSLSLYHASYSFWFSAWWYGKCNRLLPTLYLPAGILRKLFPRAWKGAKTCNLGLWKKDFLNVGGFDESFVGWGYEDSDLVIRLINKGILRKEGRFALPVFHLWHEENDRTHSVENYERFLQRKNSHEKN